MNKNAKWTIMIAAALVLLIAGATVAYSKLGADFESPQLAVVGNEKDHTQQIDIEEQPNIKDEAEEQAYTKTQADTEETEKETIQAPDFTMYDMEGNALNLSDFSGKPVILNFWASWCGPCKSEMPDFQEAYKEYGEEIQFLMVNLTDGYQETVEKASSFINDAGYTFPVYFDTDTAGAATFGVYSIPMTFFIDKDGNMAAYAQGAINQETLQTGINMIYNR